MFPSPPGSGAGSCSLTPSLVGQGSFSLWHLFSTGFRAAPSSATAARCPKCLFGLDLVGVFFRGVLVTSQAHLPRQPGCECSQTYHAGRFGHFVTFGCDATAPKAAMVPTATQATLG